MKRLRLALLIAGAIALSQLPASANDIEFGGVTIPSQQTLSPATHDDIAFRPACSQLVPIQQGEWVFWTVTLSDGEQRTQKSIHPMPTEDAYINSTPTACANWVALRCRCCSPPKSHIARSHSLA